MSQNRSVEFLRIVRSGPHTLSEIAGEMGLPLSDAREILHRGYDAGRLSINDKDRQRIVIEERIPEVSS